MTTKRPGHVYKPLPNWKHTATKLYHFREFEGSIPFAAHESVGKDTYFESH